LGEILQQIQNRRNEIQNGCLDSNVDQICEQNAEAAIGIVNRHEANLTKYRSRKYFTCLFTSNNDESIQIYISIGLQTPPWILGGAVIDFNELELGGKLGSGGFGDVHVGLWKNNCQVAIKKLRVQRVSQERKEQFQVQHT
jgi:hypothetical protein